MSAWGGKNEVTGEISYSDAIVQLSYIFCYCAVNVYAIISGYLMSGVEHIKLGRIIELWLEVLFFSVTISAIHAILTGNISFKELLCALFPILTRRWWYVSSYFAIFLFIPYFNKLIKNMSRSDYKKFLVLICLVFSLGSTISSAAGIDTFNLATGCSPVWLMMLYFFGGYKRKYGGNEKNWNYFGKYVICGLALFLVWLITLVVTKKIFGVDKLSNLFIAYTSPFVIYMAYEFVQFCVGLNISNCKVIQKISEITLGVYLVSEHPVIREKYVVNSMLSYTNLSVAPRLGILLLATTIMFSCALFLSCIQNLFFKLLKIRKLADQMGNYINKHCRF